MMDALYVLEQKVAVLIDLVAKTRADNARLLQENVQLAQEIECMKSSYIDNEETRRKIAQEKELTKSVVDELIQRISLLSQNETLL